MSALYPDHASRPAADLRVTPATPPVRHIFRNETLWYAATSVEEAERLARHDAGEEPGGDDDGRSSCGPWEQVPDDELLAVIDEDTGQRHVFPASWWANHDPDAGPTGFICTTEF